MSTHIFQHIERSHSFSYVLSLKQIAPVQTKDEPLANRMHCVVSTAGSIFYFHSPRATKCLLVARLHNSPPWPINRQRYKPRRVKQIRRAALFVARGDENLTKICNIDRNCPAVSLMNVNIKKTGEVSVLIHTIILWHSCSASYEQGLIRSFQAST